MILISAFVADEQGNPIPSFRMVPITLDCPYIECQFDPRRKVLSTIMKDTYVDRQMAYRRDENGDPMMRKGAKKEGPVQYQMRESEHVVNFLFHVLENDDIKNFIRRFAVNHETFDYDRWFAEPEETKPEFNLEIVKN